MPAAFEACFSNAGAGTARFCVWHYPTQLQPHSLVVHVHAFAEEMNKSRRMVALQARALAAAGHAVLLFDLTGCGDSPADFKQATWDLWLEDVAAACEWARNRWAQQWPQLPPAPAEACWLWGHRVGCLLATQALAQLPGAWKLLLWQPVANGQTALQQFLRLEVAAALLGKSAADGKPSARQRLAAGQAVEVAGYSVNPELASGLAAARLHPPSTATSVAWLDVAPQIAEPTPVVLAALERWRAAGSTVWHAPVQGPTFWQTTEIEDAPELVPATLQALAAAGVPSQTDDGRAAAEL